LRDAVSGFIVDEGPVNARGKRICPPLRRDVHQLDVAAIACTADGSVDDALDAFRERACFGVGGSHITSTVD